MTAIASIVTRTTSTAIGLVGLALVALLAGCSAPPTVGDGDLGVDWAILPTPSVPQPPVGRCTGPDSSTGALRVSWSVPLAQAPSVPCTEPHLSETFSVGVLPADVDTDPNTVPTAGTARFRHAYDVCAQQSAEYLGRDFHSSRLAVVPVMPTDQQWAGRARWFRCEVLEVADSQRSIVTRSTSLRDALRGTGELVASCADVKLTVVGGATAVDSFRFLPCAQAHEVELTGGYTVADGDYPARSALYAAVNTGCRGVAEKYVGASVTVLLRTGSAAYLFGSDITKDMWSVGERTAWCFYGARNLKHTGSVRDLRKSPY